MTPARPLEDLARSVDQARADLEHLHHELEEAQGTVRERIDALVGAGVRAEIAALTELGGRATSRQVASVLLSGELTRGQVLSVGRRLHGLETRGYLRRVGDEWLLPDGEAGS